MPDSADVDDPPRRRRKSILVDPSESPRSRSRRRGSRSNSRVRIQDNPPVMSDYDDDDGGRPRVQQRNGRPEFVADGPGRKPPELERKTAPRNREFRDKRDGYESDEGEALKAAKGSNSGRARARTVPGEGDDYDDPPPYKSRSGVGSRDGSPSRKHKYGAAGVAGAVAGGTAGAAAAKYAAGDSDAGPRRRPRRYEDDPGDDDDAPPRRGGTRAPGVARPPRRGGYNDYEDDAEPRRPRGGGDRGPPSRNPRRGGYDDDDEPHDGTRMRRPARYDDGYDDRQRRPPVDRPQRRLQRPVDDDALYDRRRPPPRRDDAYYESDRGAPPRSRRDAPRRHYDDDRYDDRRMPQRSKSLGGHDDRRRDRDRDRDRERDRGGRDGRDGKSDDWKKTASAMFMTSAMPLIKKQGGKILKKELEKYMGK